MKRTFLGLAAAVALGGLGTISSAQAAPVGPGAATGLAGAPVERVAMGCGPGFGRDAYGRCRPFARRYWGPRRFYGRRCFLRPTPFGPRRVCRF